MRRPRGGAVCRSLPTAACASPLRVGGGSRWALPGVWRVGGLCVCAVCARPAPWCERRGEKGVVGARHLVGPGCPSPAAVVRRRSLSRPPSPPSRSRWRCCGPGLGRLARERVPRMLSLGVRLGWKMDLSRMGGWMDGWMDGWREGLAWTARRPWRRGRGVGPAPGIGRERPASQASRDRPRVWVAVGSRAGFPGGPAVSRCFLVPGTAPSPPSRGRCCVCWPAPPRCCRPSSSSRARDRLCPLPPPVPRGLGPSWPRLTRVSSHGLCRGRWRPRVVQRPRGPERGMGRAGGSLWRTEGSRV